MPEKGKGEDCARVPPSDTRAVPVTNALLHFSFVPIPSQKSNITCMIEVEKRRVIREWGDGNGRYIISSREAHIRNKTTGDDRGHTFRPGHLPVQLAIRPSPDVAS